MLYETTAMFGLACAHRAVRYTIRGGRAVVPNIRTLVQIL
jgi:hypothetical protein